MTKTVKVRNTLTGQTATISERQFRNRAIVNPEYVIEVDSKAKNYVPELYKPRTAEEFKNDHPVTEPEDAVVEFDDPEDED